MNKLKYLFFLFIATSLNCNSQTSKDNEVYIKDFKWSIIIPEGFEKVATEELQKLQNKGADAFEKTIGQEVVNGSTTIFVFKSDQFHYLESNYQPFDKATDGNFLDLSKNIYDIMYETLKNQLPKAKIERNISTEKINGLVFQTFKAKIELQNKTEINLLMYNRLFGGKILTVTITYINKVQGEKMLESWRNSKFKR
ncbi:hypothetical protein [Flavobacterium microcysteis]